MPSKSLYRLARHALSPELKGRGFLERDGEYLRLLDSGVVHLIGLSRDPRGAESFNVMCGVNAIAIKEEVGSYGYTKSDGCRHLTTKGWDCNSGRWPCASEEEVQESLTAVRELIVSLALPWLDSHTTLSSVAEEFNETRMPHLGWMKARLYLLDGNFVSAMAASENYTIWAAKPRNWGTREFQLEDITRAERIRQEIEEAKRALR